MINKSLLTALLAFGLLHCTSYAQSTKRNWINLWEEGSPYINTSVVEREKTPEPNLRLTDVGNPGFVVYPPKENAPKTNTAIIIFPGGGYAHLAITKGGFALADWFTAKGITCFVVKYRVPKDRLAALQDGQRVVRMIRSQAKKWGIDKNKIGVLGCSAGGHLCARLSNGDKKANYVSSDASDKQSFTPSFTILLYPAYLENKETGGIAEETKVSKRNAPTLIFQAKDDKSFIKGTQQYFQKLSAMNTKHKAYFYERGGHGFGLSLTEEYKASEWPNKAIEWMKEIKML